MKIIRFKSLIITAILAISLSTVDSVSAKDINNLELITKDSITLEAFNIEGKPEVGTVVTVRLLNTVEEPEVVFQGEVDKSGKILFNAKKTTKRLEDTPSDIQDYVYEVSFVSPLAEFKLEYFTVSKPKEGKQIAHKDLESLEAAQPTNVKINFKGEDNRPKNDKDKPVSTLADRPDGCFYIGNFVYRCTVNANEYTQDTRIGGVNLSNGEKASFKLTTSAQNSLSTGFKGTGSGWSIDNSVKMTSVSGTTATYNFDGTCISFNGSSICNGATRGVYAKYLYRYEEQEIWLRNDYLRTEHRVFPKSFVGSSATVQWFHNVSNSKPKAEVIANQHGAYFEISKNASTTKSYSTDREYTLAFTIPTPIGSFNGNNTTVHKNAHEMTWSTTTNNIYYHYDMGTNNSMYFATY
ncbi:hypothetical protein [Paenibacillus sp. PAMC21692]|uniref:hypothetical protein n=1 Tax=Paenibacillus sp. PAMC21692 TaxID=2762320 RepID=UPI00164DB3C7|nr:hypothetical protein [Paenibacillus sp. PAMC21692]QNK58009.1 hypothetical protein H7F31_03350 [Paenibacillus sp. PAMC21692]